MSALTLAEVLRRIDGPVEPPAGFADALLTELLEELVPEAAEPPVERRRRWPRLPRWEAPRPWVRVAVAATAAVALAIAIVVVQLPTGRPDALAVLREAQTAFSTLPPFRASFVERFPARAGGPDLVIEHEVGFLDETHFVHRVVSQSWDELGRGAGSLDRVHAGEWWAADGEVFGHFLPVSETLFVTPVAQEPGLAFFAAGQLDPLVQYVPERGDPYFAAHCEVLPDATVLGRAVARLHCADAAAAWDAEWSIDRETGMVLRIEDRKEGLRLGVTALDLAPTFAPDAFDVTVPDGAAVAWTGGGTPPPEFLEELGPAVSTFPVGNNPEGVTIGADAVWVSYTEGGTGDVATGGTAAIARLDPVTGDVVARIAIPAGITALPHGWVGALTHVVGMLATDDAVFVSYTDAGDGPVNVAWIDPATNELRRPLITLAPTEGFSGGGLGFADGTLWVVRGDGGRTPKGYRTPFSSIVRLDPATGSPIDEFPVPGAVQGGVAVDGETLWVYAWVPADPSESRYFATLFGLDRETGAVTNEVRVPDRTGNFTADEGDLWVRVGGGLKPGALLRLDPATGATRARIPIGPGDGDVAVGEGTVWVTNDLDNTLMAVGPATNEVEGTVRVGQTPLVVGVADGAVWVTNLRDATVARVFVWAI